jgi:CheY-like chemotaxis protein
MARHHKVLLVASGGLIRNVRVAGLEVQGYEVIVASSGRQAAEMLRANGAITVLITDADLGGEIDGLAVARLARETMPSVDVIYTSRMPHRITHAEKVSGAPTIRDPYHSHQLVAVLSHLRQRSPEGGISSAA